MARPSPTLSCIHGRVGPPAPSGGHFSCGSHTLSSLGSGNAALNPHYAQRWGHVISRVWNSRSLDFLSGRLPSSAFLVVETSADGLRIVFFVRCNYVAADHGFACLLRFVSVVCLDGRKLNFSAVWSLIELKFRHEV